MFRKILIASVIATVSGSCFAATGLPQVVTSEVFYTQEKTVDENTFVDQASYSDQENSQVVQDVVLSDVPVWPIAGSDADVNVVCNDSGCKQSGVASDNIKIVSKIGADLVVEN